MAEVIAHCCPGMGFATAQRIFSPHLHAATFDTGTDSKPRLIVVVNFCPWCGKAIELVEDR